MVPFTLVSKVSSMCSAVILPSASWLPAPALAKTMSRVPRSAFTAAYSRSRSASSETEPFTARALGPSSATAASSDSCRRPKMKTKAPSSMKRFAAARPMPVAPPVITAVFPANFCPCLLLICFPLFVFRFFFLNLRFSSKADIVIEFAEFEQGFDVFPGFGKPAQVFGKERKCFGVAVRRAFVHESRPGLDFPWRARGLGMGLNPFEHFPVTFAGCQFLQQGIGIEAKKLHQALVGWGIVYIFAILAGEGRPALVEHAFQNHVVAQANAKARGGR